MLQKEYDTKGEKKMKGRIKSSFEVLHQILNNMEGWEYAVSKTEKESHIKIWKISQENKILSVEIPYEEEDPVHSFLFYLRLRWTVLTPIHIYIKKSFPILYTSLFQCVDSLIMDIRDDVMYCLPDKYTHDLSEKVDINDFWDIQNEISNLDRCLTNMAYKCRSEACCDIILNGVRGIRAIRDMVDEMFQIYGISSEEIENFIQFESHVLSGYNPPSTIKTILSDTLPGVQEIVSEERDVKQLCKQIEHDFFVYEMLQNCEEQEVAVILDMINNGKFTY